jgi:maltose O-acetyltransferase
MSRIATVLREELGMTDVAPARWIALGLVRLLPRWRFGRVRARLYRWAGCRVASKAMLLGTLDVRGPQPAWQRRLSIGEGAFLTTGISIVLDGNCSIGRNVTISPGVTIHTGTHQVGPSERRCDPAAIGKDIVIDDGAWICMNVLILPGVRVGKGAVVAAGSVVVSDVPDNAFVAGNPAVVKRMMPEDGAR